MQNQLVDHLILLVGGNPLPNYVAARVLAKPGATLHFICSRGKRGTRKIANETAETLKLIAERAGLGGSFQFNFIEVDERDAHSIDDGVSKLMKALPAREWIGLNYTGGTKVMSVHAYRIAERVAQERGLKVQYSYLDASTLSFRLHDVSGSRTERLPAANLLILPLERLLRLHQIRLDEAQPPLVKPIAAQLANALAHLHATEAGAGLWFSVRRDKSKNWTHLPPSEPALAGVEAAWREMCGGQEPTPDGVAQALQCGKPPYKLSSCAEYFKGKWLEDHVLDQLQQVLQARSDCVDVMAGLKCIRKVSEGEADNFDLDVVMMHSYQLFTFSCMVSNVKEACKEHLIEVLVRARQMGGDEARVGLVCLYSDSKRLQNEIENAWDADGKVQVFGLKDLPNLAQGIHDWLNKQGQEEAR